MGGGPTDRRVSIAKPLYIILPYYVEIRPKLHLNHLWRKGHHNSALHNQSLTELGPLAIDRSLVEYIQQSCLVSLLQALPQQPKLSFCGSNLGCGAHTIDNKKHCPEKDVTRFDAHIVVEAVVGALVAKADVEETDVA